MGFPSASGEAAPPTPPLGTRGAPIGAPPAPIWEEKKIEAPWAPHWGRQLTPPSAAIKEKLAHENSGRLRRPKWIYKLDPFHEDSEYVFGFEIGQRESGFDSDRTE